MATDKPVTPPAPPPQPTRAPTPPPPRSPEFSEGHGAGVTIARNFTPAPGSNPPPRPAK